MDKDLKGTSAFITGGGSGIGRAAAQALARRGCLVIVAGRTTRTLEETVELIEAEGGCAKHVACDVADEQSVRDAVGTAAAANEGRLDFGVNCAGISGGDDLRSLADYDTAQFDRILAVDLRGTFLSMKHELKRMQAQGFGAIVNIGSGASLVGASGFAGYVAAKHGVAGLTKVAALDYAGQGIRVNAIAAGLVDTPLTASGRPPEVMKARIEAHPIGRIGQASEIADAVVWLCSGASSFVTGAVIAVDGGYSAR
jgi:NAD(P)-dependent dehydrogenase (short-subunit alcohol dehydrogenase family)